MYFSSTASTSSCSALEMRSSEEMTITTPLSFFRIPLAHSVAGVLARLGISAFISSEGEYISTTSSTERASSTSFILVMRTLIFSSPISFLSYPSTYLRSTTGIILSRRLMMSSRNLGVLGIGVGLPTYSILVIPSISTAYVSPSSVNNMYFLSISVPQLTITF